LRKFCIIDIQTLLQMIKRIFPLVLFMLTTYFAIAQNPKIVKTGKHDATHNPSMVCPPGSNPDAGTSTQTLFANAQSNDVLFLCLGDSMDIQHFGGDLSGDPQPASAPGFSYVFYNCPPTVSGPSEALILLDPCHIAPPSITAVQAGVDINGNATFFNNGLIQNIFNAGNPMTIWFAPITLDDFASFGTEQDPNTGEQGPCMDINIADAFTVTYLNAIEGININTAANGSCGGSFTVVGGLPEFDMSTYTNISITLNTDPSVEADINGANFTHNDLIEFTVPQSGIYNVLVEDDKSCAASFTINMTACQDVVFNATDEFAAPGSTICVPISVSNFTDVLSFQYTIEWDPTVLQLPTPISSSVNELGPLTDLFFGPASPTSSLTVSWSDADFSGETLADGTGIFEICFTVIGPIGSSTPITFSGNLTQIEVLDPSFQQIGFIGEAGSVTVAGSLTLTFTSCSSPAGGANVGTFTVTTSGGVPPYSYTWVNTMNAGISGSGNIFTNGGSDIVGDNMPPGDVPLAPGTFQVIVTDANGVPDTANVEIFNAPELLVFIDGTPPTCSNTADGTFEITSLPLGGIGPYDIVWSNMATGVTSISGLTQGAYSVTVTDAAGCVEVAQNGLQTPPIVIDTISLQHVTCNGPGNDGAIIVQASGGNVAPGNDYDYAWDNAAIGPNISSLTPGTYCVSVTDDNSCEVVQCITINAPAPPIIIDWDSVTVSCPLDMNGELTVNAIAGNSAIDSYTWDPAQPGADETITGLGPGTYYVSITAVDGCIVVDSATLYAPTILMFDSAQTQPPNCPGDVNGSVTVFVSGGTGPYTYSWNTGAVSNFPLLPGLIGDSTYTVTVTDSGTCGDTVIQSIYLANPPSIVVEFASLQPVTCNGGIPCDGQATAIASGGTSNTGMYNFNWQSGETFSGVSQSTAMQLCQGVFTLEVNDGLCSVTVDTVISAPSPLQVDLDNSSTTPASCFGALDGGATIQGIGGIPGYTYQWINPNINGPTISNVAAGFYDVIITDANGCTFPVNIEVSQPDSLVALISGTMDANCAGLTDGMMEVTWTGGNPGNATYAWTNNVSNTSEANNLAAGTYTVTVTDQNGCNDIATGVINEPPPIEFVIDTIIDPLCFGFQTFITIDTAFGGEDGFNPPYSFSVDGGFAQPITGSIPVLAGNHLITVFDNSMGLCSSDTTVTINQPPAVIVNLGPDVEIELGDSVNLDPVIGSLLPIDSIIWSPLTALNCIDSICSEVFVSPLETTMYSVNVVDINGCSGADDILVEVDKNRNVFIPNIFTPDGDGFNDIFRVFTGAGVAKINFMHVYDRWGEKVFETKEFIPGDFNNPGWDGYFKGKVMNPAVFIYLIEVEFADGIVLLYRGDVTLIH
jgi:gliding motility-associated-like protein